MTTRTTSPRKSISPRKRTVDPKRTHSITSTLIAYVGYERNLKDTGFAFGCGTLDSMDSATYEGLSQLEKRSKVQDSVDAHYRANLRGSSNLYLWALWLVDNGEPQMTMTELVKNVSRTRMLDYLEAKRVSRQGPVERHWENERFDFPAKKRFKMGELAKK